MKTNNPFDQETEIEEQTTSPYQDSGFEEEQESFENDNDKKKKQQQEIKAPVTEEEEIVPTPDEWIDIEGRKYKVPRGLRHSIFTFESGKRQTTKSGKTLTSPKGAEGMTQIMPETAKGVGFPNTKNIYDNISGGIKYLREGYDIAKKKGYDDATAWEMASRGYLNGHNRQEQELFDGNVYTSQYAEKVLQGWDANIAKGERDDDWNDETYLTDYERKALGLTVKQQEDINEGTTSISAEMEAKEKTGETPEDQTQPAPAISQEGKIDVVGTFEKSGLTKEDADDFIKSGVKEDEIGKFIGSRKVKKYIDENYGADFTDSVIRNFQAKNPNEKYLTEQGVNEAIKTAGRQVELTKDQKESVKQNLGNYYNEYQSYLNKTGQFETGESYSAFIALKNKQLKNDPSSIKLKADLGTVRGVGGKSVKLSNREDIEDEYQPVTKGNTPLDVQAQIYSEASVSGDSNLNSPTRKRGLEQFYKNNGVNPNSLNPQQRQEYFNAYNKMLGTVASIAPDGNTQKLKETAVNELIRVVSQEGVSGLNKPENVWIRQFAFNNKDFPEILRNNAIDVYEKLVRTDYGKIISSVDSLNQYNLNIQKQIASGVVPEQTYATEVNFSKYYQEAGGVYTIANRRLFSDTAKGLGFSDEEVKMALDKNPARIFSASSGYKQEVRNIEDFSESDKVGGAVVSTYFLSKSQIKDLMDSRRALSNGYTDLNQYQASIDGSISNSIRKAGVEIAQEGEKFAKSELKAYQEQPDTFIGNALSFLKLASAGVSSGVGTGLNRIAGLGANLLDIGYAVKTAKATPFSTSQESNQRDREIEQMKESALAVIQKTPKTINLDRYKAGFGAKAVFGISEGFSNFAIQLPIYSLYGSSLASTFATSSVLNTADQFYTGNLSSLTTSMAMDIAMFGLGRAVNRGLGGQLTKDGTREGGFLFKKNLQGAKPVAQSVTEGADNVFAKSISEQSAEFITALTTKAGKALGISAKQADGISKYIPLLSANPNLVADTFGRYVGNITEGVYQFSLPLLKSYIDTNLTKEGQQLKSDYEAIGSGKEITYPKGIVSEEQKKSYREDIVERYDSMISAFSAQGIASNLAMTVALPFMHSSQKAKDSEIIKDAGNNISLPKGEKVYTTLVEGVDGQKYAEYSALVNLPSGRQEYLVIPKESSLVRDALKSGNLVRTTKDVVDKKLFISRVNYRVESPKEYEAIAKASQDGVIKTLEEMNPVFNEEVKQKVLSESSRISENQDAIAKENLEARKEEDVNLSKLNDEDLKLLIEQEKTKAQEKSIQENKKLEEIDRLIKDENTTPEKREGLVKEFNQILKGGKTAEEIDKERNKPKTFLEEVPKKEETKSTSKEEVKSLLEIEADLVNEKTVSLKDLDINQKKAVAKLVSEGKGYISARGDLISAKLKEKDSNYGTESQRTKELEFIKQSADESAKDSDKVKSILEAPTTSSKEVETGKVVTKEEKTTTEPLNAKEGISGSVTKYKLKGSNKVVEVEKELKSSIITKTGEVISKSVLDIVKEQKEGIKKFEISNNKAIDTSAKEFSADNTESTAIKGNDFSVIGNESFMKKVESAVFNENVSVTSDGFIIDSQDIPQIVKNLEKQGFVDEAKFLTDISSGEPILFVNGSKTGSLEVTSAHEILHKNRKEFIKHTFTKNDVEYADKDGSLSAVRKALPDSNFYKTISDSDLMDEILAFGITEGRNTGLKVPVKILNKALVDVIDAINQNYPKDTIETIVSKTLADFEDLSKAVTFSEPKAVQVKEDVIKNAIKSGVSELKLKELIGIKEGDYEKPENQKYKSAIIEQSIIASNEAESFVSVENIQNQRKESVTEPIREGNAVIVPKDSKELIPDGGTLNKLGLRKIDTENNQKFKDWFRNSEVKDEFGKPIQMYHATRYNFDTFDISKVSIDNLSFHIGTERQSNAFVKSGVGQIMPVYVRAEKPLVLQDANGWGASPVMSELLNNKEFESFVYLDKKNKEFTPEFSAVRDDVIYFLSEADKVGSDWKNSNAYEDAQSYRRIANNVVISYLKSKGYDSIKYVNRYEGLNPDDKSKIDYTTDGEPTLTTDRIDMSDEQFIKDYKAEYSYLVFDANQIKSSIGNNGEFSDSNPSILFKKDSPITEKEEKLLTIRQPIEDFNSRNFIKQMVNIFSSEVLKFRTIRELKDFVISKGYTGVEYLDRKGNVDETWINPYRLSVDIDILSDKEFIKYYPNTKKIKSSIENLDIREISILFSKTFDSPEEENHQLTISRLTKDGNPFSLTGVSGEESKEAITTKAKPVFNFFVKDIEDGQYYYEKEFGKEGKPHLNFKQFETSSNFRLYDVYKDYQTGGRGLWKELGRARAIDKLIEEGYEGFYNSNNEVGKTFRNRVSLFDIPQVRDKILRGNSKNKISDDTAISSSITKTNLESEKHIEKISKEEGKESNIAETLDKSLGKDYFNIDEIEFDNEIDSKIVYDYSKLNMGINKVGKKNGISHRQVRKILTKYEIPMKESFSDKTINLTPEQFEKAVEFHYSKDPKIYKPISQIALMFDVGKESLARQFRDAGLKVDDSKTASSKITKGFYNIKGDVNSKGKTIGFDSSYELAFINKVENDKNVLKFDRYKGKGIPYEIEGKKRHYYPDFVVEYLDGTKDLIEIKPEKDQINPKNLAKFESARNKFKELGYKDYKVLGAIDIGFDAFASIDLTKVDLDEKIIKSLKNGIRNAKRFVKLSEKDIKTSDKSLKKIDEQEQIKNLQTFDEGEWLDLATNIAQNKSLSAQETFKIRELVNKKDLEGLQKFVSNLNKQGILEFISTARKAGLLSGIKTSARNITSNVIFQALEEVARIPASTLDIGRSVIFGKDRTIQGFSPVGIGRGVYKAVTEGLKDGALTIWNGQNYFNYDDIHIAREKVTGYKVLDYSIGKLNRLVFRSLSAQDQVIRKFAEERARYEIAKLKAKNNGTKTLDEYQSLNDAEKSEADFMASIAVFQNENRFNTAYQNFRGNRSEVVKFLLDLKIPFAKTTSNIFDRILDYSGIWGIAKLVDSDKQAFRKIISDDEVAKSFNFALSKGLVGLGLMGLGYSMAQKGVLYGFNDDSDEELKKIQELEGSGAGMVKVANRWYDINSLSPISAMFLTGATYYRMKERQEIENTIKSNPDATEEETAQIRTKTQKYVNITKILINLAQQSPFVKVGTDLTTQRFYGSPLDFDNLVPLDSFVPSLVSEIAQLNDPIKRAQVPDEKGAIGTEMVNRIGLNGTWLGNYLGKGLDKIQVRAKNRIPFVRNELKPKKNVFGQDIKQPFAFDPFLSKEDTSSEITKESKKLGFNIPIPKRKSGQSVEEYGEIKKESGDIVSEIMNTIISDSKYSEANDNLKSKMLGITNSIKKDLPRDKRLHNVDVLITRESMRKSILEELSKPEYKMSDKEKKSFITSLFTKAVSTETRSVKSGKEALNQIKKNVKMVIKENYENWLESKESREELKEEAKKEDN